MINSPNQVYPNRYSGPAGTMLNGARLFELACNIHSGDVLTERNSNYLESILPANTLFFLADTTKYLHPTGFEPFPIETMQAMLRNDSAGIFCRRMYHDETGTEGNYSLCVAQLGKDKNDRDISCGIIYSEGWGETEKFEADFYGLISTIRRFYDEFGRSQAVAKFLEEGDSFRYMIDQPAGTIVSRRTPQRQLNSRIIADWDRLIAGQFLARISEENFDSSGTVIFDRHIRNLNIAKFRLLDFGFILLSFQPSEPAPGETGEYDQIVRNFSHQMCNKLAALQTSASQLLLRSGRIGGENEAALMQIVSTVAEKMDNLVSRLHQYSHCVKEREEEFDLSQLLQQTARSFRRSGSRIVINGDVSKFEMKGEAEKMMQALEELLSNAVEAGGPENEIAITMREDSVGVKLAITNFCREVQGGAGYVPSGSMAQPFTSTKPNRTGMGLCISRRIIEEHNGTMHIAGDGAGRVTVDILFPYATDRR